MCMCACHSGGVGVCTCACARVTTLPTCPHGIVVGRGICGQCEHAETEQALHRVMDERNAALLRIDMALALLDAHRKSSPPGFEDCCQCRACEMGRVLR